MSFATLRSFVLTIPLIVLATFVMGTLSLIASFFDRTGNTQHRIARLWARMLLAVSGVKVTLRGLDQIDPAKSYVFVSNHLSYMDTPVILASIPVEFRFFAKQGLFQIPLLGTHLARAGHLPVVRDDPRASLKSMTEGARIIRERGISVLVFPEGGRAHDGLLQPFKEGAAFIAIKSGVPAVPIAVVGTWNVLPFGSATIRPGRVELRIAAPIPTSSLTARDREVLTQTFRARAVELIGRP